MAPGRTTRRSTSAARKRKPSEENDVDVDVNVNVNMDVNVNVNVNVNGEDQDESEEGGGGGRAVATGTTKKLKSETAAACSPSSVAATATASTHTTSTTTEEEEEEEKEELPPTTGRLILLLSPAKTLDTSTDDPRTSTPHQPLPWTIPNCGAAKTNQLIRVMKDHATSVSDLSRLLGISTTLAERAQQQWQQMELYPHDNPDEENHNNNNNHNDVTNNITTTTTTTTLPPSSPGSKPAIFAFQGVAFQGLDAQSLSVPALHYLQDKLRILDALYGWLRPMDIVQPYRLELSTTRVWDKLQTAKCPPRLAEYWKPALRDAIRYEKERCGTTNTNHDNHDNNNHDDNNHASNTANANNATTTNIDWNEYDSQQKNHPVLLINVASDEYAAAVAGIPPSLMKMVKVQFRQGGKTVPAVHAKRARGLLVRYCALHHVDRLSQLYHFDMEGYRYDPHASNWDALRCVDDQKEGTSSLSLSSASATSTVTSTATSTVRATSTATLVFDRPAHWKATTTNTTTTTTSSKTRTKTTKS